jgi:hypothetical protein
VLTHSLYKRSSIIHRCYNTQSFSTTKRCSVILQSYSTQLFFATTLLSHYSLLQRMRPLRHFAKWPTSVTVVGARGWEAAWSRACTEVTRVSVAGVRPSRSCGGTGSSCARGVPGTVALARSDHGWLVQVMDLPVHHPRWWIAASYIYIYIHTHTLFIT